MHHLQPTSAWQASSVSALHLVSRGCGTPASFSWLELFALLLLLRREGGNITRGTAGRVATADRSDGARLTGTADAIIGSAHAISAATRAIPTFGELRPAAKTFLPPSPSLFDADDRRTDGSVRAALWREHVFLLGSLCGGPFAAGAACVLRPQQAEPGCLECAGTSVREGSGSHFTAHRRGRTAA